MVLDSTVEGILVFDRDQRLRLVNKRAAALARLPPEAIVGLKIGDFVAMTLEDSGGDTSRSRVDAILERFVGGPDITVGVRRHELAADLVLEIRTNSLGEDGWVMVTSDVTAAHRNAEALRESEAVLKEKSAALEVAKEGITINVVCPTTTQTPMVQPTGDDDIPDDLVRRMTRANPIPQPWLQPGDVSRGVVYLVTDPGVITGSVLEVGLGGSARMH